MSDFQKQAQQFQTLMINYVTATIDVYAAWYGIGSWHAFGEGADVDYVVLATDDLLAHLEDEGFTQTSQNYGDDVFLTMRRGYLNLICTKSQKFYEDSVTAYNVVKALNLRDKQDRVTVHRIIVDGEPG